MYSVLLEEGKKQKRDTMTGGGGSDISKDLSDIILISASFPPLRERVRDRQRTGAEGTGPALCIWTFYIWTSAGIMTLLPTRYA